MQRAARLLLWVGLAIFIVGVMGCGAGCVGGLGGALEGDTSAAESGGTVAAWSIMLMGLSLFMIIVGALLKAFAPKSTE